MAGWRGGQTGGEGMRVRGQRGGVGEILSQCREAEYPQSSPMPLKASPLNYHNRVIPMHQLATISMIPVNKGREGDSPRHQNALKFILLKVFHSENCHAIIEGQSM
jgi:hypothetical protein